MKIPCPLVCIAALFVSLAHGPGALGASAPLRMLLTESAQPMAIDSYDSPRRANQLALFDAKFGVSTMTIGPCVEARVTDGVITSIEKNGNASIPPVGYCISGAGTAAAWMEANLAVGQRVAVGLARGGLSRFTVVRDVDGVNAPAKPGGMFVYTPSVATGMRTSASAVGCYEVVVNNGIVSSVGGAGSAIPQTGFVVAVYGAGDAKEWVLANLEPGVRVSFDGTALTAVGDTSRFAFRARVALSGLDKLFDTSKLRMTSEAIAEFALRREAVASAVAVSQRSLESGDEEGATLAALDACDLAAGAPSLAAPTRSVEFRGVWHRPVEMSREAIAQTVKTLALANVNMLFLEVFYGGRTIYPSRVAQQNPDFSGVDLLPVWVDEAHKAGLELHAWVHTLRFTEQGPILSTSPAWAATYRSPELRVSGAPVVDTSVDFADPSNPVVRAFVVGLVSELAAVYGLDGIHLDYIRYGSGDDIPQGYSYSEWSRAAFRLEYGIDPSLISSRNASVWREWKAWRRLQVTELVRLLRSCLLTTNPHIALSAAVVGDTAEARNTRLQDWPAWVEEGLLDFVTPMLYHTEATWVESATRRAGDTVGVRALVASGVGAFLGLEAPTLVKQVQSTRAGGAQGAALFALHSLTGGQLRALQAGLFRVPAVVPYRGAGPVRAAVAAFAGDLQTQLAGMQSAPASSVKVSAELSLWLASGFEALPSAQFEAVLLELLVRLQRAAPAASELGGQLEELVKLCMTATRWERLHGSAGA